MARVGTGGTFMTPGRSYVSITAAFPAEGPAVAWGSRSQLIYSFVSPVEPAKRKPVSGNSSAFKVPHGLSLKETEYKPIWLYAEGEVAACSMARVHSWGDSLHPAELLGL